MSGFQKRTWIKKPNSIVEDWIINYLMVEHSKILSFWWFLIDTFISTNLYIFYNALHFPYVFCLRNQLISKNTNAFNKFRKKRRPINSNFYRLRLIRQGWSSRKSPLSMCVNVSVHVRVFMCAYVCVCVCVLMSVCMSVCIELRANVYNDTGSLNFWEKNWTI